MFVIILLERKYTISIFLNFNGRIIFLNKSFSKIIPRINTTIGNKSTQFLALPLSYNRNNFSLKISFSTFLNLCISQISQKSCKCIQAFSLELPQNLSLAIKLSSPCDKAIATKARYLSTPRVRSGSSP
jgi:hypothetical protein